MSATPAAQAIRELQEAAQAEFIQYGPADEGGAPIAATFQQYEAEYGAIRARVGIMHLPQRGAIRVTGSDRQDFLHRLLTNDVLKLEVGASRRAFLLTHQGRIQADLRILQQDDATLLVLDRLDVQTTLEALDAKLFTEDVTLTDVSGDVEAFALHGPSALPLLAAVADDDVAAMEVGGVRSVAIGGSRVTVYRLDDAGVVGLHLLVDGAAAATIYRKLLDAAGFDPSADPKDAEEAQRRRQTLRGRPVGWLAYNTARIEAGTALFHVDFGPDALPAETGETTLNETVSFVKGCYVGQEIVARMKSLGHPKRVLVGLEFDRDTLPVDGSPVLEGDPDGTKAATAGQQVGVITSATISPMLGRTAVAFAQVKWSHHPVGTPVRVACEGRMTTAKTHALRFLA